MENSRLIRIYNLISTLLSLTGIILISSNIFDLKAPNMFSHPSPDNLTLPPGFSFSIWGVLYFGFLLYSIYQFLPGQLDNPRITRTETYITYSIFLNFAWVLSTGISLTILPYIVQWIMLALSLFILFSYGTPNASRPLTERIIYGIFAMYAGWLTVGIVPFTTDLLLQTGWRGEPLTPTLVAIIVYVLTAILVLVAYRELKHTWYIFPLIWLLLSLSVKFSGTLAWTAGSLAVLVSIFFVFKLVQSAYTENENYFRYPLFSRRTHRT
jgi:hypothetical protein